MLKRCKRSVFALAFCFGLLLYFLGCRTHRKTNCSRHPVGEDQYEALLRKHEEDHLQYTTNLTKQITQLKRHLQETSRQLQRFAEQSAVMIPLQSDDLEGKSHSVMEEFLQKQLRHAEIHAGVQLPNEFAVLPFETFTLDRVYQLETGLTRNPEERPVRQDRRNELNGVLESALHVLNQPQVGDSQHRRIYSPKDFLEGILRTEKDKGTVYDLAFKEKNCPDFRRLVFFRPFAPMMKVKDEFIDTSKIVINVIVPLTKRVDLFRQFIQNFSEVCIRQDGIVHLTVVFFGSEKMDEVKRILVLISRKMKRRIFTLIHLNEEFSRGRGLDVGARAWKHSNALLFFCDVNVHFTAEFLNSCRMNAQPGKSVFYPVMFSQYNPEVVYGQSAPPAKEQLVIRKDFGFWKDLDFGVTCQYRSDFINIGGFERRAPDDLHLYRKFLHSHLMVVRSPSRGLIQIWQETLCPEHLSTETFHMCLQSKAVSEASLSQLGEIYFHQQINNQLQKYNSKLNTNS